ncbi:Protein BUD31 homolog 1 (Protein G10 homolog 1), partial [Durusdinium trenchii]
EELRERLQEDPGNKSKAEVLWPVHQINWQKSRFVYDLHHKFGRISKEVLDYCVSNKLVDGPLIKMWQKPGYEKLCSTFVINPSNYPYGTTSLCRVPRSSLSKDAVGRRDNTTGCRGCASGAEGFHNIFGNKYGQRLAKILVLREAYEAREVEKRKEEDKIELNKVWATEASAAQASD